MTPDDRNRRALLLTADHEARHLLASALEHRGFEVLAAADGARGLELLLDHLLELDVLVTDHDLPGRDGASLLRLVRVAGGEHDLAIVVRGPDSERASHRAMYALGADAVVDASVRAERIAAAAEEAVATRAVLALPALAAA